MKQTIIYLAGCKGDWRGRVEERWAGREDIFPIDPFKEGQACIFEFTQDDLEDVSRSNYLLAFHGYHVFDGLAVECGYAYALNIPIVYVCTQPRISSMIAGISKAVFTELEPALDYLERMMENEQVITGEAQEQCAWPETTSDTIESHPAPSETGRGLYYGAFGGVLGRRS